MSFPAFVIAAAICAVPMTAAALDKKPEENPSFTAPVIAREEPDAVTAEEDEIVIPSEGRLVIDIPAPEVITGATRPPLEGVPLALTDMIRLDRPYAADEQAPEGCIDKPALAARFCVDAMAWPAEMKAVLLDDPTLYSPDDAILRYDGDRVSQAHVLFPAGNFLDVVAFLERRFGPPTEEQIIKVSIPEAPPIINTVALWKSIGDDGPDVILEVRAHDDLRRPFPDNAHGFVWLHRADATPVFHNLSAVDLMVLRKRRIRIWPNDTDERAARP